MTRNLGSGSRKRRLTAVERETLVMTCILQGGSYEDAAKDAGYKSAASAYSAMGRAMTRRVKVRDELADFALERRLLQLEELYTYTRKRALRGNDRAMGNLLQIHDRLVKLEGIEPITRSSITLTMQSELDGEIKEMIDDFRKLSAPDQQLIIEGTPE